MECSVASSVTYSESRLELSEFMYEVSLEFNIAKGLKLLQVALNLSQNCSLNQEQSHYGPSLVDYKFDDI